METGLKTRTREASSNMARAHSMGLSTNPTPAPPLLQSDLLQITLCQNHMQEVQKEQLLLTLATIQKVTARQPMTPQQLLAYLGEHHPHMRGASLALPKHGNRGRHLAQINCGDMQREK